ncbi:MAG TPA: glucose-6-phosphate isomerase [Streptosporangiaceae bacterium]|nr:glucose-6-phosphate isomerase [Streptosporangiaceae bacterium]
MSQEGGAAPPQGNGGPAGCPFGPGRAASGAGVTVQVPGIAASEAAGQAAAALAAEGAPAALASADATLWGPQAQEDASAGLGWLRAPEASRRLLPEIAGIAERARRDGLDHIVLAGMGGSSLAPGVIAGAAGVPLTVLDTTDPHQVARALGEALERTLVVVSSKNGTTIETDSHRRIYERAFAQLGMSRPDVARRFVVVTDPGSPLDKLAADAGYHVVRADPHAGGAYSALTAFGLVPSALAGADIAALLAEGDAAAATLATPDGPGAALGAALGGYASAGHDKAVLAGPGSGLPGFGDWAEQLIAGSTGKEGRGILPVMVEDQDAPGFSPGPDIHLIVLANRQGADGSGGPGGCGAAEQAGSAGQPAKPADTMVTGPLGAQFVVWEYAVALAGKLLGINPFGQRGAAEAEQRTLSLLERAAAGPLPAGEPAFTDGAVEVHADPGLLNGAGNLPAVIDELLLTLPERGYLAVMAYLDPAGDARTRELRRALAARTTHPVTFGWGPRFLHSTGQYHKGGPQTGVFLQITGAVTDDIEVPGRPFTLGRLQLAQALSDLDALRSRNRPAVRLHLRNRDAGIAQLLGAAAVRGAE